jgi:hypothetical protein
LADARAALRATLPEQRINYHHLLVEVDDGQPRVTMNRLELTNGKEAWTEPDSVKITIPEAAAKAAAP